MENNEKDLKTTYFTKDGWVMSGARECTIAKSVCYSYQPLPDITAWELAQVIHTNMKVQGGWYLTQEEYDALPAGVKRHLPLID